MRKILGFGVVLAAAYLTGTVGTAFGQAGGAPAVPNSAARQAIETVAPGATGAPAQAPGTAVNPAAGTNVPAPGTAGSILNQAGVTGTTTTPGAAATPAPSTGIGAATGAPNYQVPGTAGTVLNQAGVTGTTTAPAAPGTVNAGTAYAPNATTSAYPSTTGAPGMMQGTYPASVTAATPGYVGRTMPGMAGYNNVNPMGTTMAPGYYYAGTAGTPYTTYNTPGYGNTGYYSTQPYAVQRRGLFGRRNRITYPASPYGYTTYQSAPSAYTTYGTTTYYTTPGVYSYGNSTYTTPGVYRYGR